MLFWFPVLFFIIAFVSKGRRQLFKQSTCVAHVELSLLSGISSVKQKEKSCSAAEVICDDGSNTSASQKSDSFSVTLLTWAIRSTLNETSLSLTQGSVFWFHVFFLSPMFRVGFFVYFAVTLLLSFSVSLKLWASMKRTRRQAGEWKVHYFCNIISTPLVFSPCEDFN